MRSLSTCLLLMVLAATAHAREWDDRVTRAAQANFPEYLALLAIPNVAAEPADIQRNATFLEAALKRRGFRTQLMANPANRPQVFAQLSSPSANAKSVLFYIHFDPSTPTTTSTRTTKTCASATSSAARSRSTVCW